ncbi:hypothetical protein [Ramlibacter sp.]|uniref:hypothetical protein n=1 Tax=Ramlibacter sp. TaxID=1917967 RepID=UPI002FC963D0
MRAAGALREEGYVDRVMDPGVLAPSAFAAGEKPDTRGFRTWSVETRVGAAQSDGLTLRSATELGQSFRYQHETASHGAFQVEADWRHGPDSPDFAVGSVSSASRRNSGRLTVRNFGFPLTARTFADSAVGDIYSEVTQVLSRTYRLSLGSSVVRGASTRVSGEGYEVRAGAGQRGSLAGSPYPGFEAARGSLAWAGGSVQVSSQVGVGVQVNQATGIPAFGGFFPLATGEEDVTSVAAGVSLGAPANAPGPKGRLVYLRSHAGAATLAPDAQGWFGEGAFVTGAFEHDLGLYATEANLRFGDYTLGTADQHGAYWRFSTSGTRHSFSGGLDYERQEADAVSGGAESRRVGVTGGGQYRISRVDLVGGYASLGFTRYAAGSVAALDGAHRSISANVFYQTRVASFAPSRVRFSTYRNEQLVADDLPATGEELAWEQEWVQGSYDDPQRPEFNTTLAVARERSAGRSELQPSVGATFRLWPQPDWLAAGTLRYTARDSNLYTSRGLSGTLTTEKQVAQGWRLGAALSLNQAVVRVASAGVSEPEVVRGNDRSISVYLRWEGAAGTTQQGLGMREAGTAGTGSVGGIVFLDADRDGRQTLNELGAAGVEVILDGRFRVVTDRFGRFDFPLVATGRHQLTLTPETVPLPWGVARSQDVRVEVPLRGEAFIRIPVVRTGD